MQAVAGKLAGRDVIPDFAVFRGLCERVLEEVAKVLLRLGDVLTPVQKRGEFGVAAPATNPTGTRTRISTLTGLRA